MTANVHTFKARQLRLPDELWEELNQWAVKEERSVNSQIIWALRKQLAASGRARWLQKPQEKSE